MLHGIVGRPIKAEGMAYAPINEQGVVFLFGRLAPRLGFHVESIQIGFPDCIARRSRKHGFECCRIEFEYRASNYQRDRHPPRGTDVIVCWDNDWVRRPQKYQHLEIIDLKRYVGASPRVFVVGSDERQPQNKYLDRRSYLDWSVPLSAQVDDLIVMYRARLTSEIRDLWKVVGPFYNDPKWGFQAYLRLVIRLNTPVTFRDLRKDPSTRNLRIVRQKFQGRTDITDEWPYIYQKLITLNPRSKKALAKYSPEL